jgi:hypothetical protein
VKICRSLLPALLLSTALATASASSVRPMTFDEQVQSVGAIFRGTVLRVECFRDETNGMIYTRAALQVDEGFKGRLPAVINVVHRGGVAGGIGLMEDASPQFKPGEERLLFVSRRNDGTLFAALGEAGALKLHRAKGGVFVPNHENLLQALRHRAGPAISSGDDVTDQAGYFSAGDVFSAPSGDSSGTSTNGLLADTNGFPSRYVLPDRGEPIPYLVDATFLPTGITLPDALNAVSNAMSAWSSASSFKFIFAGTNNFGQAPAFINNNDGIFRIQLHDNYHYIAGSNVLGIGGSWFIPQPLTNTTWRAGGNVAGMDFNLGVNGYVILKHTNVVMQTLSTFAEVLTHEIGHVIGLAHSSEVATNDPALSNSIMFYQAHEDGRGASLNSYDTNVVRQVHPANTPPYSYARVMDITTSPSGAPNVAGINQIELRGYDLQSANPALWVTNATAGAGSFFVVGNVLKFSPSAYYSASRVDPATTAYYDSIYARFSDGTNASPYILVRTISLNPDSDSPSSDGIPDSWMTNYFGHSAPQSGDKSRATDDSDGDRLNNLQEYIAGMNPKDTNSTQRITSFSPGTLQFQAKAYELYQILGSTNLAGTNWTRVVNPVLPTNAPLVIRTNLLAANIIAVVSNLPATNPRMFFRVLKVP